MMSENIEQFKEIARQIEGEEHGDRERESDRDEREYHRSNFERERKLDSHASGRYQPYSTSRADRESSRSSSREKRVYVYNLPFSLKWKDLEDHMKRAGDVVFAEIMEDSEGRSKGCGIVEFVSSDDAQRAIRELNDTNLGGRMMKIREDRQDDDDRRRRSRDKGSSRDSYRDRSPVRKGLGLGLGQFGLLQRLNTRGSDRADPVSSSVFVSNLDYKVDWAKLKDSFKPAGRVVRADVAEDVDKKSKGHGTVIFETPLEAINAVFLMNGKTIYGRAMNVRLDRESPYFNLLGGDGGKSSNLAAAASLQNSLSGLTGLAGLTGLGGGMTGLGGGMNPLALLQLQNMANLNNMAGLGNIASLSGLTGLGGLGAMNYGSNSNSASVQNSQSLGSDASSLGSLANPSTLNTAANALASGNAGSTNPYALWMQQLYGMQGYSGGLQGYTGGNSESQSHSKGDPAKQVFVRNLAWKVSWQELKDKFREAGRVVRADILMDEQKRSRGCGTVLFETAEDANHAVSMFNGTMLDGREMEVRMDRG